MSPADLPQPLVPSEVDLTGLGFMPLRHLRVMQSTLFIKSTGDEFKAAFALWCASWTEIPAGSLPDDDELLESLSRSKIWKKVKTRALHGWMPCSDGRLYHKVIAPLAIDAWERREDFRVEQDNKESRQKRWRERVKRLSALLRDAGVTSPSGASMKELVALCFTHVDGFVDDQASTSASTSPSTASSTDGPPETAKTGTGTGTGTTKKNKREAKSETEEEPVMTAKDLVTEGVSAKAAADWLRVRRAKKSPLTQTAWDGVKREAALANCSPAQAVKHAAENNWAGFKAVWLERDQQPPGGNGRATETPHHRQQRELHASLSGGRVALQSPQSAKPLKPTQEVLDAIPTNLLG